MKRVRRARLSARPTQPLHEGLSRRLAGESTSKEGSSDVCSEKPKKTLDDALADEPFAKRARLAVIRNSNRAMTSVKIVAASCAAARTAKGAPTGCTTDRISTAADNVIGDTDAPQITSSAESTSASIRLPRSFEFRPIGAHGKTGHSDSVGGVDSTSATLDCKDEDHNTNVGNQNDKGISMHCISTEDCVKACASDAGKGFGECQAERAGLGLQEEPKERAGTNHLEDETSAENPPTSGEALFLAGKAKDSSDLPARDPLLSLEPGRASSLLGVHRFEHSNIREVLGGVSVALWRREAQHRPDPFYLGGHRETCLSFGTGEKSVENGSGKGSGDFPVSVEGRGREGWRQRGHRLRNVGLQREMTAEMRTILVDWMMEVSREYGMKARTLQLSLNYLDRYLSLVSDVPKRRLQLLGATCLFVASKFEEIYPPRVQDFAVATESYCTAQEIRRMERRLLTTLRWRLAPATCSCWTGLFLQRLARQAFGPDGLHPRSENAADTEARLSLAPGTCIGTGLGSERGTPEPDSTEKSEGGNDVPAAPDLTPALDRRATRRQTLSSRKAEVHSVSAESGAPSVDRIAHEAGGDCFLVPEAASRNLFLHERAADLVDLALLDVHSLRFRRSHLAAAALMVAARARDASHPSHQRHPTEADLSCRTATTSGLGKWERRVREAFGTVVGSEASRAGDRTGGDDVATGWRECLEWIESLAQAEEDTQRSGILGHDSGPMSRVPSERVQKDVDRSEWPLLQQYNPSGARIVRALIGSRQLRVHRDHTCGRSAQASASTASSSPVTRTSCSLETSRVLPESSTGENFSPIDRVREASEEPGFDPAHGNVENCDALLADEEDLSSSGEEDWSGISAP